MNTIELPVVEQLDTKSKEQWVRLSAQTALAAAGASPSETNRDLDAAAQREPQSPAASAYRLWAADNFAREGRFLEAAKTYDVALDVALSSRRLHTDVDPVSCSLLHKAQAAFQGGDRKLAIGTYRELAKASAANDPLFYAGLIAEQNGDDTQAADLYRATAAGAPSRRTDKPAELARRALLRMSDRGAFYANSAERLSDLLIDALEKSDTARLSRLVSRTHFAAGVLGGHTAFEEFDLLDSLFQDLGKGAVQARRKLIGSGEKLYLLTTGWNGDWFRGQVIFLLNRAPKGWQWTGVAISEPNALWAERWRPSETQAATDVTTQALPFPVLAPWPAKTSFMAGGLTDFAVKQAAIVAAGPVLGAAMAIGFASNPCGFGPRGFYYNEGSTHDAEDAFAIDFTRYRTNVPYDNESGGTPVLATHGGMVISVSAGTSTGSSSASNTVEINHADPANPSNTNRFRSRYLHMEGPFRICVSPMMAVIAGQRLGFMDDTGNSVLDHLHFSIHDRTLPHPNVSYGRSVRPSPMSGVGLGDGGSATCVTSTNLERVPGLNFSPTSIAFGPVPVGDIATRTLTMENTTGAALTVSFPASSSGPFRWPAFNQSIPNGQKRSVMVEFMPLGAGSMSKTLSVTSTAPGSPHAIKVSGTGLDGVDPL